MSAFYSHHLETERLPSGVFFANAGRALPEPNSKANARPNLGSVFPTFPIRQKGAGAVTDKAPMCLPLLDVSVNVCVDSIVASTKLVQRFTNISADNISEAHYTFPLYDGAVITSFRCEIGDSKMLEGQVKPKADAKREYQRAIEKMEAAALLEEHTPEVFETKIGNVPAKSVIRVEIIYLNELEADAGGEGVLLTIPTSIAPRYGHSPQEISSASEVTETGLRIEVAVSSPDSIRRLESCTHPVSVEIGRAGPPAGAVSFSDLAKGKNNEEAYDQRKAMARLAERDASMGKDFVLLIQTSGSSFLRSRAVLSPPNAVGHSALMVTIKPSELFTDLSTLDGFNGEIIFLADRSGSMAGSKMNALRDVLGVFLKSLPETCFFNLFSFGSNFFSLWDISKAYNQENLDIAMSHVSGFQADMGGTDLLPALKRGVERRSKGASSTQVILLTDGEIWETEETINFVRRTASKLGEHIRFFALGIGNEVSHRLIQGIAGEGGGFGEVVGVDSQGKWQERVIRMLRGALMPKSWACEIDLGPGYAVKSLETDDLMKVEPNGGNASSVANLTGLIQAPRRISALHHFTQKSVFFLIFSSKSATPPIEATVKAKADGGSTSTCSLPVVHTVEDASTIQHLSVKAALMDLESHTLQSVSQTIVRQNAELLGEMYSISSKWTSFVAVDPATQAADEINMYKASVKELSLLTRPAHQETRQRSTLSLLPSLGLVRTGSPRTAIIPRAAHHHSYSRATPPVSIYFNAQKREYDISGESDDEAAQPSAKHTRALSATSTDILWSDIVASQTATGIFQLDDDLRRKLAQHFCPGTRGAVLAFMGGPGLLSTNLKSDEAQNRMLDTLMIICYVRTHLYQKGNLWDLMIFKSEIAVTAYLPSGWTPYDMHKFLEPSIEHQHYRQYRAQVGNEFPQSKKWTFCPVCSATAGESSDSAAVKFRCGFGECEDVYTNWDDLWEHQVSQGHARCPTEEYAPTTQNQETEAQRLNDDEAC